MTKVILILGILLFLFLFAMVAIPVFAQAEQAGITGTVRDRQGGAIPDAVIEVEQAETRLVRITHTSNSGAFFMGALPVGNYSLTIRQAGFDTAKINDLR